MCSNVAINKTQLPIVVSGPSGLEKGHWFRSSFERHPDVFVVTISHTTRKPRPGELESENNTYNFVDFVDFQSLIDQNAFVEHTFFSGNHYGTSWQTIMDQQSKGKTLILDLDMNGVKNIRDMSNHFAVRCAFIAPPSLHVLKDRLRSRGTETDVSIQTRMVQAGLDINFADTRGVDDILIINDDLDDAYRSFEEWALRMQ